MDTVFTAWIALGLTVLIQAVGIGVFVGTVRNEQKRLRQDLEEHRDLNMPRAHGCPFFIRSTEHADPP